METIAISGYRDLKRCWMRRKYTRLQSEVIYNKRRLKVEKLGGRSRRGVWKIKRTARLQNLQQLKRVFSPLKLLGMFHDAYVKAMIGWANRMGKASKGYHVSVASGEKVDVKLVIEMYKRVLGSSSLF